MILSNCNTEWHRDVFIDIKKHRFPTVWQSGTLNDKLPEAESKGRGEAERIILK